MGIIEGFFGPEWSWEARHHFCEVLPTYGGEFYIYAPKRDSFLRKNWTRDHPAEVWNELQKLSSKCGQLKIAFGVGLSPFELHTHWNSQTKNLLRNKINSLVELNLQYIGIFFDDMKSSPDLAEKQIEILEYVKSVTDKKILFCPTYYTDDPILDKVFGQRPVDYLEKIGTLSQGIQIFWTGSKVIPKSISAAELQKVAKILKRKPLIWDNYFANDGPRQCKFLNLKPLEGRSELALQNSSGWAFNLMNQPMLSEILFASAVGVLKNCNAPSSAFLKEFEKIIDSKILKDHRVDFVELGLDGMTDKLKTHLVGLLASEGPSKEIGDWLNGRYLVGEECLTD